MIVYDDVCTPCARKQVWKELRAIARSNVMSITRKDIKKQPEFKDEMWWGSSSIPLPVVVYFKPDGNRVAVNANELIRLHKEQL